MLREVEGSARYREWNAARQALLAPLHVSDVRTWQEDVLGHVARLLGSDHAGFWMPRGDDFSVAEWQMPLDLVATLAAQTKAPGSGSRRERLMQQATRQRLYGGSGVYHERDLTDRATVERSPFYQEVLRPEGICYTIGMSVRLPVGEAAMCLAFEAKEAEGFGDNGLQLLERLLPAFEAGVIMRHRLQAQRRALVRTLDQLREALYICDADGRVLHQNTALKRMLAEEPDDGVLLGAIKTLADGLRRRRVAPQAKTTAVVDMLPETCDMETGGACYKLTATYAPPDLFGDEAVMVRTIRTGLALPSAIRLATHFGLTPRQAQVALLVAQGRTNKEVAKELAISAHTVKRHVANLLRKMDVSSRQMVLLKLLRDA